MKFYKMQGAGNDFVVVQTADSRHDWAKLAVAMCDRHHGIGADGVLLSLPSTVADFRMRVFNADGSESKACGNGMRCLVKRYLDEHQVTSPESEVTIETPAGMRKARVHRHRGKITEIQASMGLPKIGHNGTSAILHMVKRKPADVIKDMNRTVTADGRDLLLSLISIGNPHAVHFYNGSISDFPLSTIGPLVEEHQLFPDETNFEIARMVNHKEVEARVWERGCGETLACGSGACAIGVSGILQGYFDNKVDVKLPGGTLNVEWDGRGEVFLSGPATTVFEGEWPN